MLSKKQNKTKKKKTTTTKKKNLHKITAESDCSETYNKLLKCQMFDARKTLSPRGNCHSTGAKCMYYIDLFHNFHTDGGVLYDKETVKDPFV